MKRKIIPLMIISFATMVGLGLFYSFLKEADNVQVYEKRSIELLINQLEINLEFYDSYLNQELPEKNMKIANTLLLNSYYSYTNTVNALNVGKEPTHLEVIRLFEQYWSICVEVNPKQENLERLKMIIVGLRDLKNEI